MRMTRQRKAIIELFEENKNQQIARAEQGEKGVRDSWMVNEETVGGVKECKNSLIGKVMGEKVSNYTGS